MCDIAEVIGRKGQRSIYVFIYVSQSWTLRIHVCHLKVAHEPFLLDILQIAGHRSSQRRNFTHDFSN